MKDLITNSRVSAFRRCARYHQYRYNDQLVPVSSLSRKRDWGTVMHLALEQYDAHDASFDAIDAGSRMILDSALDDYDKTAAWVVFAGYVERWRETDRQTESLGAEVEFVAPLINPDTGAPSKLFELAGKIDSLLRADGKTWIKEHKSTGSDISPGSNYWQHTRMSSQLSTYVDGAKHLGHAIAGIIYDVLKRPGQEPRKATPPELRKYTKGKACKLCGGKGEEPGSGCTACMQSGWFVVDGQPSAPRLYAAQRDEDETPAEYGLRISDDIAANPDGYYQRQTIVMFERELEKSRRDLWQVVQALRSSQRTGTDYRNPDACTRFGSTCEYMPLCTGEAEPSDPTRYQRVDSPHAELQLDKPKEGNHADYASNQATVTAA